MNDVPEHHSSILKIRSESGSENVYYSVLYESLPDEFRLVAEQELNETDEKRRKGMQKLKEIIKRENMHSFKDIYLLSVLRCCKYNLRKAEVRLKKFAVVHREIAGLAAKLDLSKAEYIIDDMGCGIIPYRDRHGCPIVYTRPYGIDLEKYAIEEVGTVYMVSILFLLSFPITTVAGVVYFGDCRSPNISIFYPIFKLLKTLCVPFFSLPMRFKKGEIIDSFTLVRWFVNFLGTILSDKIMKRITLHSSNSDKLHKDYDRSILPDVFGGSFGPLSSKVYKHKLLEFLRDLKTEYQETGSRSWRNTNIE